MGALLSGILTPAFVSLIVSLWVGLRLEAKRARRDNITKLFESVRDDVRRGVDAGVDYFSTEPFDRTPLQESKVLLTDREIREAVPVLVDRVDPLHCDLENRAVRKAFEDMVVELTGGNFQSAEGGIDKDHIRRLIFAGAQLRTALARLRDAELKALIANDPISRKAMPILDWGRENNPFRRFRAPPVLAQKDVDVVAKPGDR